MDSNTQRTHSEKMHRSDVRWKIALPFLGGLALMIGLVVIAALEGSAPTSAVASTLLTVLLLCPLAICLFPIYVLLALAAISMGRAHDLTSQPLRRIEALSLSLRERTLAVTERAAHATLNLNARFALLDRLIFSAFDRPADQEDDHE